MIDKQYGQYYNRLVTENVHGFRRTVKRTSPELEDALFFRKVCKPLQINEATLMGFVMKTDNEGAHKRGKRGLL